MDPLSMELIKIDNQISKWNQQKYLLLKKHPNFLLNNLDNEIEDSSIIMDHYDGYETDLEEFIGYL